MHYNKKGEIKGVCVCESEREEESLYKQTTFVYRQHNCLCRTSPRSIC